MSDRMTLVVVIVVLVSLAMAIAEPFVPASGGGYYRPGPEEGVLPFQ